MFTPFELTPLGKRAEVDIVSLDREIISCGRDVDNDVLIDSDSVSRRHAYFVAAGGEWVLVDLESTNHSWVNGEQIAPGRFFPLRHGDIVKLADIRLRFGFANRSDRETAKQSLLIFAGERFEREVAFASIGSEFVVGANDGDLVLDEPVFGNETLSIRLTPRGFELDARATAMKVLLNGQEVTGRVDLEDRSMVAVGLFSLVIVDDQHPKIAQEVKGSGSDSSSEEVGNIFDRSVKRVQDSGNVRDWEEEEVSDNPFAEREASFKQTIAIKSRPGSGFGQLAEDDPYSSFASLREPRKASEEETNTVQVILGVVLVIFMLVGLFYIFYL